MRSVHPVAEASVQRGRRAGDLQLRHEGAREGLGKDPGEGHLSMTPYVPLLQRDLDFAMLLVDTN